MRGDLLERSDRAIVALDRDDAGGAERQQRAGEPARPGPTSKTVTPASGPAARAMRAVEIEIEQKILSERFSRNEAVAANDLAQRRQAVVWRARSRRRQRSAGLPRPARRDASRSAATRLAGSARPVPAMSKAVP